MIKHYERKMGENYCTVLQRKFLGRRKINEPELEHQENPEKVDKSKSKQRRVQEN